MGERKVGKGYEKHAIKGPLWIYILSKWVSKTHMWLVGYYNLPYVGQNTNLVIESYHSNLKATLGIKRKSSWSSN